MNNTNYTRSKKSGIFKIISIVLIATFFVQNIVWANQDTGGGNAAFNTLQVQSAFAPLVNPRLQHEALIKLPLDYVLKKIGKLNIDKFDIKLTPKLFLNNSKNIIKESGKVTLPQYRDKNGEYVNVVLDFEGKWKSNKHLFLPCAIKYKGFSSWEYVAEIDPMTGGFVLMKKGEVTPDVQSFAKQVTVPIWHKSWHALWQKRASSMRKVDSELSDMIAMDKLIYQLKDISEKIDQAKTETAIVACESTLQALGTRKRNKEKKSGIAVLKQGLNLLRKGSLHDSQNKIKMAARYFRQRKEDAKKIAMTVQLKEFHLLINEINKRNEGIIKGFVEPVKAAAETGNFKVCRDLLSRSTRAFMREPEFRMLIPFVWMCISEIDDAKDPHIIRADIKNAMDKLHWLVRASNESNSFMQSFRLTLVKRAIYENTDYKQLQEEGFGNMFKSFLGRPGLIRGSPELFWTMLYQTAFISLEKNDPQKPSERIQSPVFKSVDSLISIKLVRSFATLTKSRNFPKQNPETTNILKKFASEGKNKFTDLIEDERRIVFMALVKDHKLDIVNAIHLQTSLSMQEFTVINDMAFGEMSKIISMSVAGALDLAKTKQLFITEDGQFHYFGGGMIPHENDYSEHFRKETLRDITEGLDPDQKDFLSNYLRGSIDVEEAIGMCFDRELVAEAGELIVSVIKKRPKMVPGEKVSGWIKRCVKSNRMDWAGRIKAVAIDNGIKGITSAVEVIVDERFKEETLSSSSDTAVFATNDEVKGITLDMAEERIKNCFRKGGDPRGAETVMTVIENESNGITLEMMNKWIGRGIEIMIAAIESEISGITLETINKWVEMCFKQKRPVLAGKVALLAIDRRIEGITVDIVDKWIGGDFRKKYPDWYSKIAISAINNRIEGITADVVKRWMDGLCEESRPDLAGKIAMMAINKNVEGITLSVIRSAIEKCLVEGYPVTSGEIAMSFVDYLVANPDMKQIPIPELSALIASASNFLSRSGIRRSNENTLRRSMEMDDEEFRRIKGLLDELQETFRDVNNKLAPKRRYSEEIFKKIYISFAYELEIILPGSIEHLIGLLKMTKNPQVALRFFDQKKEALMDDDVAEALITFVDKIKATPRTSRKRKKVKVDMTGFYKLVNISNGFILLRNKEPLIKALSECDASTPMNILSNDLMILQLKYMAESFGMKNTEVRKEAFSKLYIPFIDRLGKAKEHIRRQTPNKFPIFEALCKAMLADRFWDFIEDDRQDDETGRVIAVHNKGIREALSLKGIDVEAWLGRDGEYRHVKHEFTHYVSDSRRSTKRFTIQPIFRNPGRDLFMGDFTDCCLAMDSNYYPEAMVDRLIDEGMNVIEVIDEHTQKPVAGTWLYIAEDGSLFVTAMEIDSSYEKIKPLKHKIGEEMVDYAISFAKHIGAKRIFMSMSRYGKFTEFIDKRYSGKKVPFKLEKIGGYFGEKYYFDTTGKDEAYLVADNLDVQKEVKSELADDPIVLQEGEDADQKNIPRKMANKFASALMSTALSKKKVVLLFSSNLKTKEAIKNVDACIDILKEDNLVGEFLAGVEREELAPEDLQKRALDLKDREDVLVFTYAPESDKVELRDMNDWATKPENTNINPAYINEEGLNEKETIEGEFYYPIFEMVTLSLIDYLTRDTSGGVYGVLKAMNIDPAKFNLRINNAVNAGDSSNIMFFVILPDAEKYDMEHRRNRYEELRHILRYL